MTKHHQTQIKLTREEVLHLLDALEGQGTDSYADDSQGYETWKRLRQRLDRAMDRLP